MLESHDNFVKQLKEILLNCPPGLVGVRVRRGAGSGAGGGVQADAGGAVRAGGVGAVAGERRRPLPRAPPGADGLSEGGEEVSHEVVLLQVNGSTKNLLLGCGNASHDQITQPTVYQLN